MKKSLKVTISQKKRTERKENGEEGKVK